MNLALVAALSAACAFPRAPTGSVDPELGLPFEDLPVPGHNPAVVSIPLGKRSPEPLLVATHGAGDRPEWHCEFWRRVVENRAFILCPRGRRTDRRVPHEHAQYYYPDHFALRREVLAAVAALRERYREALDVRDAVYTGFSQGAIQGAFVIALEAEQFPRAALVEGGNGFFDEWSAHSAERYATRGGERVLFACGSPACVRTARRCAGLLDGAGVNSQVVHAEGAGHSYGRAMEDELRRHFEWLVAGDPRWTR